MSTAVSESMSNQHMTESGLKTYVYDKHLNEYQNTIRKEISMFGPQGHLEQQKNKQTV